MSPPVNSITTGAGNKQQGEQPKADSGTNDHPSPEGTDDTKVIHASDNQAQQLLKQLKTGPQKNDSFSWFNPFSWFDRAKAQPAPVKIAPPPKVDPKKALKQAQQEQEAQKKEEQAKKKAELQQQKEEQEAAKKAERLRAQQEKEVAQEGPSNHKDDATPPESSSPEFNPMTAIEAKPDQEVHDQGQKGFWHKAFAWVPSGKSPEKEQPTQNNYILPPANAIAASSQPQPDSANNTDALQSVLGMLPKDVAANLKQVLGATSKSDKSPGAPVPVQTAPVPSQSPVPGIEKNVFDNIVSSRVSSASMPEAVNPSIPQAPPTTATTESSAGAGAPGQQQPRVEETTLDAQVARAGIYIPPQLRALPDRAKRLAGQGFAFVAPPLTNSKQYVITNAHPPEKIRKELPKDQDDPASADPWIKKMRYLLAHGTQSLGAGEAFLFSEETGEGVIFLSDGSSIRRKIEKPLGHDAVVALRRPDVYNEKGELRYNLAVLGKVLLPGKHNEQKQAQTDDLSQAPPTGPFKKDETVTQMLNESQGLFGWLKNIFSQ